MIRNFIKRKQHLIFPVLDVALNGLNYLFHVYVSWYLSGSDYGVLNALLSLSSILLVLGVSFQMTTAKRTAVNGNESEAFSDIMSNGAGLLIILILILLPLSPLLVNLTRSSFLSVLIIFFIFSINLILSILRGLMQGLKRFLRLNMSFYLEVLTKTILLFVLMRYFRSINLALLTILAGMLLSLFHGLFSFRELVLKYIRRPVISFKGKTLTFIGAVGISQFALYFFTSLDMIIVNYFLAAQSGVYAVVLKYSQLLFFVSFSILTVFIPQLSERIGNRRSFIKLSSLCMLLLSGVGAVALLFYRFIFPPTVSFFFDDQYAHASRYLLLGGISYFLLVLSFVLVNILLILDKLRFIPVLLGASISLLAILMFFHNSIEQVLYINITVFASLLLILSILFARIFRKGW